MIRVQEVLEDIPHFDGFCSVEKLHGFVECLRADPRFAIQVAGTSVNGAPIHHVRFGTGSMKALVVGGPHAPESIGSLTIFSLMTLLHQGHRALLEADVEWHIVPCIDPDGALLNEGWSQKPFTLENYMRNFYLQAYRDQVDTSFPIRHKKLVFEQPSQEAKVLQGILEQTQPDFFFSLHNASFGGAFYFLSRNIDRKYYRELHELVERQGFCIQRRPLWKEMCAEFAEGVVEMWTVKKYYDFLERTTSSPEKLVPYAAGSWDHLAQIKPSALTFVAEMGYVEHPADASEKETGQNLRKFMLRLDADSKYLATAMLEEWDKVKEHLDPANPFYRAIAGGMVLPEKERLLEGGPPLTRYPTRDILFNPQHDRIMTEGDRFNACADAILFLAQRFQFVRLLMASRQTPAVLQATERLERLFDEALAQIGTHIDLAAFEVTDYDTLAKVQLGSGLIALNSVLEARRDSSPT